ncbi:MULTISPECIES: hypothetical protein [unclassified Rhodococcus (in: high G+C Gram-positive bacteria)]|uniref:hypothetical protein n=1 Tax=unclassified Rhodococcus (in: high G+C Gram-positive bacteria) TaxID=192944 RepID=UPI000B0245F0|nr:hypothetical protein [Rhodococcus sp. M8]
MPDTRDWTFVLDGGCPECGYTLHDPATTGQRLRAGVPRWQAVLRRPNVAERPAPRVWSTLEYASHARDLIASSEDYRGRLAFLLEDLTAPAGKLQAIDTLSATPGRMTARHGIHTTRVRLDWVDEAQTTLGEEQS